MKKIQTFLLTVVAALLLTGCDQLVSKFAKPDNLDIVGAKAQVKQETMKVHKVQFSPDYKTFTVTTRMYGDIGPYSLTDTTKLRIEIKSTNSGISLSKRSQPHLIGMRNIKSDNIAKKEVDLLAMVDLTQPQEVLDRIHDYLVELRAVFSDANMQICFIYGDSTSQTRTATDYVLENYLISRQDKHILLYRSISKKMDEMEGHQGIWKDSKHMALLIFSDNEVYDNATNKPIDPDHFMYEENLTLRSEHPAKNMLVCYVGYSADKDANEQDVQVIKLLCERTNGVFMHHYNGTLFKNAMLKAFHISPDANTFTFENPDGKVYNGNFETLNVNFYSIENDTLVTSFKTVINKGDFYNPIIVHGLPKAGIVMLGIIIGASLLGFAWFLLQFVIPYISYKIFRRKYVIRYAGRNMGIGKNLVAEACYLCKEPFETGDEVVVKCSHTMHKTCWDENGYHCTEYSDRCKHGSHYYNSVHLSDSNNAPYYTKWILAAIIATTLAWILFISRTHYLTAHIVTNISLWLTGIEEGTPEAAALLAGQSISPMPAFGSSMGFFLTTAIAVLATKIVNISYNSLDYLLRSLTAAILCATSFLCINILIVVGGLHRIAILLEWIPWLLSAYIIAICGTYKTRVKLRKRLIIPSVIIVLISMYIWWLFYSHFDGIDYRLVLLLGFIFYGVGLVSCIATVAPRSERYFLHVQGAVKEMDIAIFKWFRNNPDRVVTIGKSVDCSLQLSWDITGDIAPVHAEIYLHHNVPYLKALEDGVVVNNHVAEIGKEIWLHHGLSFTIGNTTFTYIEKDLVL